MEKLVLKENITWIGALDPNLRIFDIIMETESGTDPFLREWFHTQFQQ